MKIAHRLRFIRDFYGEPYTDIEADYICCRHTLEHISEVSQFIRLVRASIGSRTGVIVFFEVPDAERVLVEGAVWDIYYEHCSYFTADSLSILFEREGFAVLDTYVLYNGQYLVIEAEVNRQSRVEEIRRDEYVCKTLTQVDQFKRSSRIQLSGLRRSVDESARRGRRVVLWGSGSKAVSLLTTLQLGDEIGAVIDINPHKWGKFLPGSGHEILSPSSIPDIKPDMVIVMNSIYTEEIRNDLERYDCYPEIISLR